MSSPGAATTHVYSPVRSVVEPGVSATRELSFAAATLEALDQEMAANPNIFVFGEGIGIRGGNFGTTVGLYAKYGAQRLRDTPIAERGFVGMAGGAAMTGARPIVDCMFIDFINDAFGELVNQIAKMQYMSSGRLKMPVLLRGCVGIGHAAALSSGTAALHLALRLLGVGHGDEVLCSSLTFSASATLLRLASRCRLSSSCRSMASSSLSSIFCILMK